MIPTNVSMVENVQLGMTRYLRASAKRDSQGINVVHQWHKVSQKIPNDGRDPYSLMIRERRGFDKF